MVLEDNAALSERGGRLKDIPAPPQTLSYFHGLFRAYSYYKGHKCVSQYNTPIIKTLCFVISFALIRK